MKKIYLSILSVAVAVGANAQLKANYGPRKVTKTTSSLLTTPSNNSPSVYEKATVIWQNDFSLPTEWSMSNTSSLGTDWVITTDVNAVPAVAPVSFTTASNGYAMIDSDSDGGAATQDAYLTFNGTIDCSLYPAVALQFEQHYRTYLDTRTIEVSNDGGTTWQVFTETDGTEANTNVEGVKGFNITAAAGGQASVSIRFHYVAAWGWHWAVDDIKVIEQPLDDVQLLNSYIVSTSNIGIEYGRTPINHIDTDWTVGSTIYNFGVNNQPSTNLVADFGSFTSNSTGLVESDSTRQIETLETLSLGVGVYNGTYTVSAGTDITGGPEFGDNLGGRSFEVTSNEYSIDGIGVYPSSTLASLGTNSFNGTATTLINQDNIFLGVMYNFKSSTVISELKVMLNTATTVAGGDIYGSIIDTTVFLNDGTSPKLAITAPVNVSAVDIANGFVTLPFPNGTTLPAGMYFACVELVSNGGANTISVLDDQTVGQPSYASMIFLPDASGSDPANTTWANGEAVGVRIMTSAVGIDENTLSGVSVFPNPSTGIITISNDNNTKNSIAIFDMLGKEVYSNTTSSELTVNLSANGTGVYLVKVTTNNGTTIERVVIK